MEPQGLQTIANLGTNALLLGGLIVVWRTWREDQKSFRESCAKSEERFVNVLTGVASALNSLSDKLES